MNAPTVKGVRVRAVIVPMSEPHRTASGVISSSPLVLIDVETSDGVAGHGIVFTYTPVALKPIATLAENLGALLIGESALPRQATEKMLKRFRLLGAHGLIGMVISGLDMALWDASARAAGQPLYKHLGGVARATPAYGAVGYDGVEGSAHAAERWAKKGMRAVKAKIGYPEVATDIAVIRAMRNAAGPDVAIMVDYNQSLSVREACERLARLENEELTWVEEPTIAEDYAGHARIAAASKVPVQAGENWWGPLEFAKAIEADAVDLLMPDVMKVFGVTGWVKIAALAQAHNLTVSNHLFPEISAQLLAVTPTAYWLEYADWWNPVIATPLQIEGGKAIPSDQPGCGMEWNEENIARFLAP